MKFEIGVSLELNLSTQSYELLAALSRKGIYGRTPEEVAVRMLDETLREFAVVPIFTINGDKVKETE